MKIQKTNKGNVKMVMSTQQYKSLRLLLDNTSPDNWEFYTQTQDDTDNLSMIWWEMEQFEL